MQEDAVGSAPMLGKRKIGLALSSGMARGWAHIGALRALGRLGVQFDVIAGASAGALVGGCYLAGKLDELEDWASSLNKRRIMSYLDLQLGYGGLIKGDRLRMELRRALGPLRIETLPTPFVAVATDLVTGHEIWLQKGDLADALRASFSLPGLFPPIELEGRWLADGALVDPLPVAACRALGAEMVIAVNLNTDIIGKSRDAARLPGSFSLDPLTLAEDKQKPFIASLTESLTRGIFRRDPDRPSIFGVMTTSLSIMQDRLTRSRLAGDPPDVHITPRVGHIGLLEFDRTEEAVREGEEAVERRRDEIADALEVMRLIRGGAS
ncbi:MULTISPECIES: patatin-like phospholipase family protein [Methylosinus]|uniref:Lysophospholipase n=1 Tax=Methylosinus trichosporium (strain ATCC 35070 / NCIMB 11131 / UNIQEM 75 / OB3b) TaxID=595536 RepID=A0A2D2D338_METT3|nr:MULTISPECIES: patatin-like phospholipase family protein [Methylosinus]ATQ69397.1 lysophospholipase [Methylosinus trichosporium OB3b]